MTGILKGVVVVLACACVYAWFVDEAIVSESIAALLCGSAGWLVALRISRVHEDRLALSTRFIVPFIVRIPYAAVRESLDLIGPMLWRAIVRRERIAGRWIALRFAHGDESAARERGRRAIVVFASNLTPNALPLDVDPGSQRLVLHQLVFRRESAAGDPTYPF